MKFKELGPRAFFQAGYLLVVGWVQDDVICVTQIRDDRVRQRDDNVSGPPLLRRALRVPRVCMRRPIPNLWRNRIGVTRRSLHLFEVPELCYFIVQPAQCCQVSLVQVNVKSKRATTHHMHGPLGMLSAA
eukprot:1596830-Rhodomonas_salina.2